MFAYRDPTGSGALEAAGALEAYRRRVDAVYRQFGSAPGSAFAVLEAFEALPADVEAREITVDWIGFPRRLQARPHEEIDEERFRLQEEYVEWIVERGVEGRVSRIIFSTEFTEYFEALAEAGVDALKHEIRALVADAEPTDEDLFGALERPEEAAGAVRAMAFRRNLTHNPWNRAPHGILCLSQPVNTMGALFALAGACAVPRTDIPAGSVCANVGGNCVPGRNSDPVVCAGLQQIARDGFAFTLPDPPGITITGLGGFWERGGERIADIGTEGGDGRLWRVSRNGRRGVLDVPEDLTLDGQPVRTGAQVAQVLKVGARVKLAPDEALPFWARTGAEDLFGGQPPRAGLVS